MKYSLYSGEDSHYILLPIVAERIVYFVGYCKVCKGCSQICLSLTQNKGTSQITINHSACVLTFFLSLESNASFPSQRETFEKL